MVVSYMSVTDFILSFTASMSNILLLVALCKVRSLHPPTKLLFRCLSVADFLSGFLNLVVSIQILISPGPNKGGSTYTGYLFHYGSLVFNLSLVFYMTSIEVSTILCVDRLLALLLGLRYKEIVTLFRVRLAVTANVLKTVFIAGLVQWLSNINITIIFTVLVLVISITTSVASYVKIFLVLRKRQTQVRDNQIQPANNQAVNGINMARYKMAVSNVGWIQFTSVVCYGFFIVVIALEGSYYFEIGVNGRIMVSLVLNAALNPMVYFWKIAEVRQAMKNTVVQSTNWLRQIFARFS